MALIARIPPDVFAQPGTLPWTGMDRWAGMEFALDDYLIHLPYRHKREHSAHIAAFRDHARRIESW